MLVSVDPGLRECGVAVFSQGRLISCGLVEGVQKDANLPREEEIACMAFMVYSAPFVHKATSLVTEEMTIYRSSKGNPNALTALSQVGAYLAGLLDRTASWKQYQARAWKGNTKKEVFTAQILEGLTDREKALMPVLPKSRAHHVLDAIALGKFHLGKAYDRS